MSSLSAANTEFCLDLFKELSKQNAGRNVFFAPVGLSAALAMVMLGARGDTAAQMEKTATKLQCDERGNVHAQFQALLLQINKCSNNYVLSIANRLYGAVGFEFIQQYLCSTKQLYHSELESVDFLNGIEKARETINSWVERQTNGKIQDLFPCGALDPSTVLVLVNAIYFKGKWLSRFKKEYTKELPFWLNKKECKNVPMMFQNGKFKLARIQEPRLQVLELPYEGGELSMIIMLPEDQDACLEELGSSLTYKKIEEWTTFSNTCPLKVDVYLPRFKLEQRYELKTTLQSMGMTDTFARGKADFTGISEKTGLFVSKVTHKVYVEVNEEGTEAAGATGIGIAPMSVHFPVVFKADRPFFFLIRNNSAANSILFFGRYISP